MRNIKRVSIYGLLASMFVLFACSAFIAFAPDNNVSKTELVKHLGTPAILDAQVIDVTPKYGRLVTVVPAKDVLPGYTPEVEYQANAPPLTKRRCN